MSENKEDVGGGRATQNGHTVRERLAQNEPTRKEGGGGNPKHGLEHPTNGAEEPGATQIGFLDGL